MTGLVRTVRNMFDDRCRVEGGLNKQGCKVPLTGTPHRRLIVDFDKPGSPLGQNSTRCDYLVIAELDKGHGWVVLLELKRGRLHADEAVGQLRAGAKAAEQRVPLGERIKFLPVAVSGKMPKAERNKLKGKGGTVRFHGCSKVVRLMTCGSPLAEMLCS